MEHTQVELPKAEKVCDKCQTSYGRDRGYKHRDGLCVERPVFVDAVNFPEPYASGMPPIESKPSAPPFTVLDWQRQLVEKEVNSRLELLRAKIEAEVIAELKIGLEELERPSF